MLVVRIFVEEEAGDCVCVSVRKGFCQDIARLSLSQGESEKEC